jgi:hypothetical protein
MPTFEVFYRNAGVGRVAGPQLDKVEAYLSQFGEPRGAPRRPRP